MSRVKLIVLSILIFTLGLLGEGVEAAQKGQGAQKGQAAKGGKKKIFVTASAASSASWTNEITTAELENALVQAGRFTVLTRSSLDTLLKEQKLAQSDLADPSQAAQVGKLVTANYVLIGKCLTADVKQEKVPFTGVTRTKMNVTFQVQLIDVETSSIIDSMQYTDKAEANVLTGKALGQDEYREMVKKFATQYVSRMSLAVPIEASVVFIKGNEVAIDAGAEASVQPGQEFEVFTEGEPIRNSAGEILSRDLTTHARIKVVRVEPKIAWATVTQSFNNGQPDPSPDINRIKRDYTVKQIGGGSLPPANTGKKNK
ncbi:MAG: hypothetical protein JNN15_01775 [Blastocatellia bacterium]|nr:hypothetical protein [Blastocatellia bacterium]